MRDKRKKWGRITAIEKRQNLSILLIDTAALLCL
jgi:hypothetical protein